jgi:hypothetical protein
MSGGYFKDCPRPDDGLQFVNRKLGRVPKKFSHLYHDKSTSKSFSSTNSSIEDVLEKEGQKSKKNKLSNSSIREDKIENLVTEKITSFRDVKSTINSSAVNLRIDNRIESVQNFSSSNMFYPNNLVYGLTSYNPSTSESKILDQKQSTGSKSLFSDNPFVDNQMEYGSQILTNGELQNSNRISSELMMNRYNFCPLPSSSTFNNFVLNGDSIKTSNGISQFYPSNSFIDPMIQPWSSSANFTKISSLSNNSSNLHVTTFYPSTITSQQTSISQRTSPKYLGKTDYFPPNRESVHRSENLNQNSDQNLLSINDIQGSELLLSLRKS